MRFISRTLLSIALLVATSAAWASENGSISGVVKDNNGLGVPGAMVKAAGGQAPRTTVTTAGGAFKFPVLLPGKYVVSADLKGLGTASQSVMVFVDNDVQLTIVLSQSTKAEVVVTGASSEIDKKASEVNFNYTDAVLKDLPLSRTYSGVLKIIPGAPADTSGIGYVSMSGGTRQDNKYLLDGVNVTNPGYGSLGVDTNQLDIADFNVKKGGITAEFGRTSGAMINAVTKSGTNQIAGALAGNISPGSFQANRKFDIQNDVSNYSGQANLGFPIMKDMLFGYVSAAYYDNTTAGQTATASGLTTTLPDSKSHNGDYFAKLTAMVGQPLLLNAGFRALPAKSTDQFNSVWDGPNAAYGADTTNYVGNVSADWFASKDTVVELKAVYLAQNDTSSAQTVVPPFQPTTINPATLGVYALFPDTTRNNGNTGIAEFAETGEKYKRTEIKSMLSQYFDLGSSQHQVKVGGGYEAAENDTVRATNGWGSWSGGIGVSCPAGVCGAASVPNTVRARYYTSQPVQFSRARTYSAFIQDTVSLKNLTIYAGVLFNKDEFAQLCKVGNVCSQVTTAPALTEDVRFNFMTFGWGDQIQPRLGITWNTNLLSSDKFYATYGQYAAMDLKSTARSFAPFRIRQDQAYFSRTTGALLGSQFRGSSGGKLIPTDLKPPHYEEIVAGYSGAVTKDVTFDVYYQYRDLRDAFEDVPIDAANYFGSFQAKNIPDARRTYQAVTLDVQKRYANGWYANMNLTFSRLYGNFDEDYGTGQFNTSSFLEDEPGWNSAEPNRDGRLGQDRPIIFKLMGSYDLPFGLVAGGFLRVQSGTPWEARGATPSTTSGRYLEPAGTNRLPTWTTFDMLLAYSLKLGGNLAVRLEGRVLNVFDTQNVLSVNTIKYNDGYADPPSPISAANLGPQGTTLPNASFGNATSWSAPRRFTISARLDF